MVCDCGCKESARGSAHGSAHESGRVYDYSVHGLISLSLRLLILHDCGGRARDCSDDGGCDFQISRVYGYALKA